MHSNLRTAFITLAGCIPTITANKLAPAGVMEHSVIVVAPWAAVALFGVIRHGSLSVGGGDCLSPSSLSHPKGREKKGKHCPSDSESLSPLA